MEQFISLINMLYSIRKDVGSMSSSVGQTKN